MRRLLGKCIGWVFRSSKMGVMETCLMAFRRILRFLSLWEFLVGALGLGRTAGVMTESRAASTGTSPRRQWADEA